MPASQSIGHMVMVGVFTAALVSWASADTLLSVAFRDKADRRADPGSNAFREWAIDSLAAPAADALRRNNENGRSISKTFSLPSGGPVDTGSAPGVLKVTITSVNLPTYGRAYRGPSGEKPQLLVVDSPPTNPGGSADLDDVYRTAVVAVPAESPTTAPLSSGTDHRLLITFSGLRSLGRYRFTFFAYDDSERQSVYVFTDVTDNPCKPLNPADAAGNNNPLVTIPSSLTPFNPGLGEHNDGTQYAPDAQYIWTNGLPPATASQYALPLEVTANGNGEVVFAETTVVNLYGHYQRFPVLNGFTVEELPVRETNAPLPSNSSEVPPREHGH